MHGLFFSILRVVHARLEWDRLRESGYLDSLHKALNSHMVRRCILGWVQNVSVLECVCGHVPSSDQGARTRAPVVRYRVSSHASVCFPFFAGFPAVGSVTFPAKLASLIQCTCEQKHPAQRRIHQNHPTKGRTAANAPRLLASPACCPWTFVRTRTCS